jgi:hypothetical protein
MRNGALRPVACLVQVVIVLKEWTIGIRSAYSTMSAPCIPAS